MKHRSLILFICSLTASVTTTMASSILDEGLLLYLPWDTSMKASVAAGENAPNKSENIEVVEGKFGKGVKLSEDARLNYPGRDNFDIQEGTIAFWAKRDIPWKQTDKGFILVKAIAGQNWNQSSFYFSITPYGQLRVWLWNEEKQQTLYMVTPIPPQADVWYHLAATFIDGEVRIYVNGEEGSYTNNGKGDPMMMMPSGEVKNLQIGSDYDHGFQGVFDEFRVYNRVLSPGEIKKLYELNP
ncbi:LamG domain-containing protein [Kiritimatiellota bacterium B12222]|nr:LamG domain-containing protein [Kiritimatiellota bacterium B12222]